MQTLYRHFNTEGVLLYVGVSKNFTDRTDKHRSKAPWFTEVSNITVDHYMTREEVLLAEKEVIQTEKPLHNILHANYKERGTRPKRIGTMDIKNAPFINADGISDIILRGTRPSIAIASLLICGLQRAKVTTTVRISLQDLQEFSKLSKPTVINALDWLEENSYLIRVGKQSYKISARLAWKGNQVDWALELRRLHLETDKTTNGEQQ